MDNKELIFNLCNNYIMELISRVQCAICSQSLHHIYTIENMYIHLCCLDYPHSDRDILSFSICTSCNTIQLDKLIPLHILYSNNHNTESLGKTWENYFQCISSKISDFVQNKIVLEIGYPSAKIASRIYGYADWYIVEPNKNVNKTYKDTIHFIPSFFDENFVFDKKIDVIVHSHVFEHIYSPNVFLEKCYELLSDTGEMIFGVPNMEYIATSNCAPCLGIFFEHTIFLNKDNICYMLEKNGFELIDILNYENHSTIYHVKKINKSILINTFCITNYSDLFMETIYKWQQFISTCKLDVSSNIFVFGASYNTQFLLALGLNVYNISGIIDNSPEKQGKYLSGYPIFSPNILSDKSNCTVIVKNGYYSNEIVEQCRKLNGQLNIIY